MKKGKILSILTTLAMTGSMVLSAVPFTANAADVYETDAALTMTADKTQFSLAEVAAGATATVKVHMTGDFGDDNLLSIEGKFDCSDSDWTVVPSNMILSSPSQIANDKGSKVRNFRSDSISTYSIWSKELPADPENAMGGKIAYVYDAGDYENGAEAPSFKMMSDLLKGHLKPGEGDSIVAFDVEFPKDLKAGDYTIQLTNVYSIVDTDGKGGMGDAFPSAGSITFTIGDGATTTAATTVATTAKTTAATTDNRNYVGTVDIWAETVKAAAGDTDVVVKVFADTKGKLIESLEFMINYDKTMLELTDIVNPADNGEPYGLDPASFDNSVANGTLLFTQVGESQITNYPDYPIAELHFTVKDTATGTIPVEIVGSTRDVPVCLQKYWPSPDFKYDYLTPSVTDGAIVIGDTTTAATTKATTASSSDNRNYVGTIDIWAETVKAAAGDTDVVVKVFADTKGKLIESLEFMINYDKTMLELTDIVNPADNGEPYGLDPASFDNSVANGTLLFTQVGESQITNYPDYPIAELHFTVKDTATGTIPVEIVGSTRDVPVCLQKYWPSPDFKYDYLTPNVTDGAIIIGDTTTAATTKATTTATTKATTAASASVSASASNSASASASLSVSVSNVVSNSASASVSVSVSKETDISVSNSASASLSVSVSNVVSNSVSVSVSVSNVVSNSVSVSVSVSKETNVSASASLSVSVSVSKETVIVTGSGTTASTGNGGGDTTSISIDLSEIEANENLQWYYADEEEFNTDGIVVKDADGNVIENAVIKFNTTPESTYDSKTFDYVVAFTVEVDGVVYGEDEPFTLNAKIGQRGDANCDHKVKANDAAFIAKNLAAMNVKDKTILTTEDGFAVFLANVNGKEVAKGDYAPYELKALDAAHIAKYLAQLGTKKPLKEIANAVR